jgi:hypothetical protein
VEGDQAPALGLRAGPKSSDRFWPLGSVRAARVLGDHERDQERGDHRRDDQPVGARGERHGGNQRNDCHYSLQALCPSALELLRIERIAMGATGEHAGAFS